MIPFVDLKAQYHSIQAEVDAAVRGILESSQFILGKEVAAFEDEFAAYSGAKFGIGVNSGTSALHLALLAAGIGPGDEVITTPFTFVATSAAIYYTGARPVYADIDPSTYVIDPAKIEARITPRTKAIMPVHLYGHCADMDPILEIARRRKLMVIEDAAQAHGAEYKGRRAGSMGDLGCFSFYPGKNLGAYGEGGLVTTSNPEFNRTIRMLRDWGMEKKYHHVLRGFNYRLEGMQGAILRVKLRHLEQWTEARRANAQIYNQLLGDSGVVTPVAASWARHVYHVYAIRAPQRDALLSTLQAQGIQAGIHYPFPVYAMEPYREPDARSEDFPNAESMAAEQLSLPMFPELTRQQMSEVAGAVQSVYAAGQVG
jgi:dTDP-4-amino-4,6-dideoxygalactose transaminase